MCTVDEERIRELEQENAALKFDAECHDRAVARDAEQYEALRAKLERAEKVLRELKKYYGPPPEDPDYLTSIVHGYFEESKCE